MDAPRRCEEVTYELVEGRAFLIDPAGREVITLNAVGSLVWEAADGQTDEAGLVQHLGTRFPDIARRRIEMDVKHFLGELRELGLLVG
jgi:hypothetical protein